MLLGLRGLVGNTRCPTRLFFAMISATEMKQYWVGMVFLDSVVRASFEKEALSDVPFVV